MSEHLVNQTWARLPAFGCRIFATCCLLFWGCSDGAPVQVDDTGSEPLADTGTDTTVYDIGLVINEVMSKNDGVVLDDELETEDWIEILNTSDAVIDLSSYTIADADNSPESLPPVDLAPGETMLLWADGDLGLRHLGFKISSEGDTLFLFDLQGRLGDLVHVTALPPNESLARLPDGVGDFVQCRYATPGKTNGEVCAPMVPPSLGTIEFDPYLWDAELFEANGPLAINELALKPATYIEVQNISGTDVDLSGYTLVVAPHWPGLPWPLESDGVQVPLGAGLLSPGELISVDVTSVDISVLEADPQFEGVVTLFESGIAAPSDRVDFMSWPADTALARMPSGTGAFAYCSNYTRDGANTCISVPGRAVGDRLRYLRTPADFGALAAGAAKLGIGSVKFVLDLEAGGAVHLLSSGAWPLHYTFVREVIDGDAPLDRCDPFENNLFHQGWWTFSVENYFDVVGRRYLLGTLSHHGGANLRCVEYASGDLISPSQMAQGFFGATLHTAAPQDWYLRPQDDDQLDKARAVEGSVPIVGPNAPFVDVTYQPLTEGVGYGYLTYIDPSELAAAALGTQTIVVTSDVPNDIPFVGGLITEAFQTPLAHVNILSQSRNTPNMALWEARQVDAIAEHLGQLVKLEVHPTHFEISNADPAEAQAHWESLIPDGPTVAPLLDLSLRDIISLTPAKGAPALANSVGFERRGAIGAKGAQLGELTRLDNGHTHCPGSVPIVLPPSAFAIPVIHYVEHFEQSGALALYQSLAADADFVEDPLARAEGLDQLRSAIMDHPVSPSLLDDVVVEVTARFGSSRVRFRSSSNTEDLLDFNGAGLYTSASAQLGDPERSISDAMRTVWASLWNTRAYDERKYAKIDHTQVAMGILVHGAFLSEKANGVAVSRDVTAPNRGDQYYVNVQAGEATVTNPAPGVTTEQFVYQWPSRLPTMHYHSQSSLIDGQVLNTTLVSGPDVQSLGEVAGEVRELMCALWAVDDHFQELFDPLEENPWFAMEVEFKLAAPDRELVIKQARPFSFGNADMPTDCSSF